MSTTTKAKAAQSDNKTKVASHFMEYLLTHGKNPTSVFLFCKNIKMEEADFYKAFNSFDSVEKFIWTSFIQNTIDRLNADEVFLNYSLREKILAFYYTYLEEISKNRSYILFAFNMKKMVFSASGMLADAKATFKLFMENLLAEGEANLEIKNRKFISDAYPTGLWAQLLFLTEFWIKDASPDFEKSDEAVEKLVNLSFDFMAQNTFDKLLDFGKFLIQNKF